MIIRNQEEFEALKRIGTIVANCLAYMKSQARVGMTTLELDELGEKFLISHGAASAPRVTYNFPGATCISLEEDCAHGIPGNQRLQSNHLINIDVSASMDGFFADNGESFVVDPKGEQGQFKLGLCQTVGKALKAAIRVAHAGQKIAQLGKEVEQIAKKNKLKIIENLGGHGVGRSLHEEPEFVQGFYNPKDRRILRENSVIAFEPFLSTVANDVVQKDDGWTLSTPGGYTVQREHSIVIGKKKAIILTNPDTTF